METTRKATWMGQPSPTICLDFFRPRPLRKGGRKKGEMYGTRMLVVCGHGRQLCWRFVVLNRDTREGTPHLGCPRFKARFLPFRSVGGAPE